ncbi:hypothetical protein E3P98_03749 [Wallemia ichthyophaga]|nr:hypothetical protein E3P98_03749 [Wallemia ichthyophaga]
MFKTLLAIASAAALVFAAPLPSQPADQVSQLDNGFGHIENIINHKRTWSTFDAVNNLGTSEDFTHAMSGFEQLDNKLKTDSAESCVEWTNGLVDQLRIAVKGCVDNINASDQSNIQANGDAIAGLLASDLGLLVERSAPKLDALLKSNVDVASLVQPLDIEIKALLDLLNSLIPDFSVRIVTQLRASGYYEISTLLYALFQGHVGGFLSGLVANVGGVLGSVLNILSLGGGIRIGGGLLGGGVGIGIQL